MSERPTIDEQSATSAATIWPISFAFGVAVLLVGLIVNPEVIAPLGAAITVVAAAAWMRGGRRGEQPTTSEQTAPQEVEPGGERYTRNRFLERATLGLGGVIAGAVALPAAGLAVLPSFLGQRRRAVDLGPVSAFPEGRFVVANDWPSARTQRIGRIAWRGG